MFNVFSGRLKTDIIDEKESLRTVWSRGLFLEISLREFEFVCLKYKACFQIFKIYQSDLGWELFN